MTQLDDRRYRKEIQSELRKRTARNSHAPILLPDSGVIPRFDPALNKQSQPINLGTTAWYQYKKSTQNQGSKPVGAQRFPKSVRNATQLTHAYLRRKPGSGPTSTQQPFTPRAFYA